VRDDRFETKKNVKVLVAHKISSTRSSFQDVLRGLGFEVEGCDAPKDVLSRLEVEEMDWVVMPIAKDDPVNAFHILEILSSTRQRLNVRVSLIVDEEEKKYLPLAFELGTMCWFPAGLSKDALAQEMKKTFDKFQRYDYDPVLLSADLLRGLMLQGSKHEQMVEFLESIYSLYPGDESILVWLAEGYFLCGKRDEGQKLVAQLKALGISAWEQLAVKYLGQNCELLPDLGIRKVVIVDPDEAVQKSITDLFTRCATADIKCYSDGMTAFEAIIKDPPDLLIQEWKIPGLSGLNLLQRLRHEGCQALPIIVLSSLLTKGDKPILSEMSVANVFEKPFREEDVLKGLVWTMQQERFPTETRDIERKMYQHLLLGHRDKAFAMRATLESSKSYTAGMRSYNDGLFHFYSGKYESARTALLSAAANGADQLKVVNLLGKCFLKLRNFREAIACFERASALSPRSIERMCAMAESHAELGNVDGAHALVEQASAQDAGAKSVKVAAGKVELHAGDSKKAAKLLAGMSGLTFLVADMNNSAVACIRVGEIQKGIDLYQKTLEALPPKEMGLKVRVQYNMALAYARKQDMEKSKEVLDAIPAGFMAPVMAKVQQFRRKLELAIRQERSIDFDKADEMPHAEIVHDAETERTSEQIVLAQPGTRCLHLIFRCPSCIRGELKDILKGAPRFKLRDSIQREDSQGLERSRK
jgi:tetratricopeptide (TPR) repeat protein